MDMNMNMNVDMNIASDQVQLSPVPSPSEWGRSAPNLVQVLLRHVSTLPILSLPPIKSSQLISTRPLNSLIFIENSVIPHDELRNLGFARVITLICSENRTHYSIRITEGKPPLCDNKNLHDFHFVDSESSPVFEEGGRTLDDVEVYNYICLKCETKVDITIRPPEFTQEELSAFDPYAIRARYDRFKSLKPGALLPNPAQCYHTLYKILVDALLANDETELKQIKATNSTLNLRMDASILPKCFFTLKDDAWRPPSLFHSAKNPYLGEVKKSLQRMATEILLLGIKVDSTNMRIFGNMKLSSGINLLYEALRCQGYYVTSRNMRYLSSSEYSFYEVLGAVEDMSDNLILECYNSQVRGDSRHAHHYMDALREISQSRQSDHLTMNVMQFLSLGAATTNDVKEAYACFNLVEDDEVTDQFIVDMYMGAIRARPSKEAYFQNALKVITGTRNSAYLQSVLNREMMDISTSYGVLQCDHLATDEEIIKSYESLMSSHDFAEEQVATMNKAILNIGKARVSALILTFISDISQITMNVDDAYEFFGLSRGDDDESIITIASIRINDTPDQIIEIRRALKAIANDKNSSAIESYLQAGSVSTKSSGKRQLEPRGLHNIGNTCYLNSLLQYYFSIKPLREAILEFENSDKKESFSDEAIEKKRLGSLPVTVSNVQKGQEFIRQLAILFRDLISTKDSVVTPTKELAYLALSTRDQGFALLEDISNASHKGKDESQDKSESQFSLIDLSSEGDNDNKSPSAQSNNLMAVKHDRGSPEAEIEIIQRDQKRHASDPVDDLEESREVDNESINGNCVVVDVTEVSVTPTGSLADTLVDDISDNELDDEKLVNTPSVSQERESEINSVLFGRQQDVTECIENFLFQIEAAYKPEAFDESGEQIDFIKKLFYGTTIQTIQPLKLDTITNSIEEAKKREKTEWFSNLLVNVADGPRDIYDALDSYFEDEVLELSEGKIKRSLAISSLPLLLQIQVQRVQYDAVLQEAFKSEAFLQYDEVIHLDRYMAENMKDVNMQQKRSEVQTWRVEIAKLKVRKKSLLEIQDNNMTFKDSLIVTRDWLKNSKDRDEEDASVSDETMRVIESEITKITKELAYINETVEDLEAKINSQFADPIYQKLGYKIQAVFIHSGKVDFGHYWTYIKDFKTDTWRKYNDEKVDIVSQQEVFHVDMNRKPVPTPYYLVFVREDLVDEFIDPLCRVVESIDEMDVGCASRE